MEFTFQTMNNVSDPADLKPGECVDIVNFDCDSDGGIKVRSALITGLIQQPVTEEKAGRDYWAVGNTVYCSKALSADEDQRYSTVISLDDMITMIKRVDGGLYIGSTTELHYLNGDDPQEGGFTDTWIREFGGVILGTGLHIRGDKVKAAGMGGNCCIFATHQGICVGGPGGNVVNLSLGKVSYDYGLFGKACIREENGQVHYLCAFSKTLPAHNDFTPLTIPTDI